MPRNYDFQNTVKKIHRRLGGKSKTKIGDVREQLRVTLDVLHVDSSVQDFFIAEHKRRAAKAKK